MRMAETGPEMGPIATNKGQTAYQARSTNVSNRVALQIQALHLYRVAKYRENLGHDMNKGIVPIIQ